MEDAVPGREDGKDAVTQKEMPSPTVNVNIGHMEPDAYMSVKHNINEEFARMLPSQVEGSGNSAVSHIMWRL